MATKQECWLVRKIFYARKWFNQNTLCTDLQQLVRKGKYNIEEAYKVVRPNFQKVNSKIMIMIQETIPTSNDPICYTEEVETLTNLFFLM